MRVHSKKSFLFRNSDGEEAKVLNEEIKTLPDWVADTLLFKLAIEDESLTVVETKAQEIAADNGELSLDKKNKKDKSETPPTKE